MSAIRHIWNNSGGGGGAGGFHTTVQATSSMPALVLTADEIQAMKRAAKFVEYAVATDPTLKELWVAFNAIERMGDETTPRIP